MQPREIRTVTVYGASSSAVSERFRAAAFEVGVLIADQGWRQVNGGGHAGMMGAATDGALSRGGVVDAVILDIFLGSVHPKLGDVVVKTNMHDRKRALFEEGDAFVVLPGGLGTMEELFEIVSWRQLEIHHRPIAILNLDGYFAPFVDFVGKGVDLGLISRSASETFKVCSEPQGLMHYLHNFERASIDKEAEPLADWNLPR
uniref:Cytokinin riboside 5'-monophosphate phosphoribohydrolase n=1 Tax=Compsopogon caeruleus TaxID=31354 RepID=A0A7S1TJ14_9RHOD|mmetsp:Transcript_6615/g.13393  ORF Transcript_6615/g.13393 Transcript_6615/m.13393 type:complete len:202 (+) Transcript_6615:1778-2383(+)